jgi:hypothetical protein
MNSSCFNIDTSLTLLADLPQGLARVVEIAMWLFFAVRRTSSVSDKPHRSSALKT